jgi:hypothetical protein
MSEPAPDLETLRAGVEWHSGYRREWDNSPDQYIDGGFVGWGRSRRLGRFTQGEIKAYLGVQHVDPGMPGWAIAGGPEARFFLSLFVSGRTVTLRTFPTFDAALRFLDSFLQARREVVPDAPID